MLLYLAALSFIVGFLVRIVDLKEDNGLRLPRFSELVLGFAYGAILAFIFSAWPHTLALFGVFLALIITRKIDAPGHFAGLAGLAFALVWLGVPVDWPMFPIALFIVTGTLDETADWLQQKKKLRKPLSTAFYIRPFSEVVAFVYSCTTGLWEVWVALLSFDVAFIVFDLIWKRRTH